MRKIAKLAAALAAAVTLATVVVPAPSSALEIGQKAPDFTLPGPEGKPVKLSDLTARGTVVVYTFIQAFTGV